MFPARRPNFTLVARTIQKV